jgi:hypothetical protein
MKYYSKKPEKKFFKSLVNICLFHYENMGPSLPGRIYSYSKNTFK